MQIRAPQIHDFAKLCYNYVFLIKKNMQQIIFDIKTLAQYDSNVKKFSKIIGSQEIEKALFFNESF